MRLALYQPDIPQNTGTILRTCACLDVPVDLIGPAGFDASERAFRRAGMDYLDAVDLTRHVSWDAFEEARQAAGHRLVVLTAHAEAPYTAHAYATTDTLLLGRETAGVPAYVTEAADVRLTIPMRPGLRSLNVAIAGAIVVGEALRQLAMR
ncbi:MAG: tRNA (cytidine(34)-2'-O)-methyltransferase [Pseudomonadota bacterium]